MGVLGTGRGMPVGCAAPAPAATRRPELDSSPSAMIGGRARWCAAFISSTMRVSGCRVGLRRLGAVGTPPARGAAGDDAGIGLVVDDDGLPAVRLELLLDLAHALAGDAVPGGVAVRDQDGEMGLERMGGRSGVR